MKHNKTTQVLGSFLGRFFHPSKDQIEAAGERVHRQLHGCLASSSDNLAAPASSLSKRRRQQQIAFAFATVAITAVVVVTATLWRNTTPLSGVSSLTPPPYLTSTVADTTITTLADGSRLEVRGGSEAIVEPSPDGLRVRLNTGSIIVTAAKQAPGRHLYVVTKDLTVSVVGTVFLVKADARGSRVAVIEGAVHVQQGALARNLEPGEQVASNEDLEELALQMEIGWSREAAAHLTLLHQALAQKLAARQASPSTASTSVKPQFEEASIRRCDQDFRPPEGMRGGGSDSLRITRGRLDVLCMTPATLIRTAYRVLENNTLPPRSFGEPLFFDLTYGLGVEDGTRVRSGPDWAHSEKYTIAAVAKGPLDAPTLGGSMLLDLLEQRFRLKVRVQPEGIQVWALRIAKSGLKIKPAEPGSCFRNPWLSPRDEEGWRRVQETRGTKPICRRTTDGAPPNIRVNFEGGTMPQLANLLSISSFQAFPDFVGPLSVSLNGLMVVNRTGIPDSDIFNFVLEFGADREHFLNTGFQAADLTGLLGPSIIDALENQLGLTLEKSTASREYIVIDHIERPSED